MRTHFVSIIALVLCTLSFWTSLARAKLVPIAITAEVTDVSGMDGLLEGRINIGDLITGVYIYDSSTPDSEPRETVGYYRHYAPPAGITLTVGGFVFMTDPENIDFTVRISNDSIPGMGMSPHDNYILSSIKNLPLPNGARVEHIQLGLAGSPSTLSSDTLPTTAPVLDDWGATFGYVSGDSSGRQGFFRFDVRLTSAALIPEPATFALLGIGSLVLLRSRRATRRNTKAER